MGASLNEITQQTADRLIEDLRYGIPPSRHTRALTVGRQDQLDVLEWSLRDGGAQALLLRANYGSGKSHLLRVVREAAIEHGYAVALVEVNTQEGIRFNRMDLVFGAVCRSIEVPGHEGRGVGGLFDAFTGTQVDDLDDAAWELREEITDYGDWAESEALESPPVFVALRAWAAAGQVPGVRELVSDWLRHPVAYRTRRRDLYERLVGWRYDEYQDLRSDKEFYYDDLLVFHPQGHRNAWTGLADLDRIAQAAGLRGLVLLFDEFEDVIQGLNNRAWQMDAFRNLFEFFQGRQFTGSSYFAVTPDFVEKCKQELLRRGVYEFPYDSFDQLPAFQLHPLSRRDFLELGERICELHSIAYGWNAHQRLSYRDISALSQPILTSSSPERIRQAIRQVVESLDELLDASS